MGEKPERLYDCPLAAAQIIWEPDDDAELPPVEVVRIGQNDDDMRYSSSWGACNQDFCEASASEQINMLMRQFVHIVAVDGADPHLTHKAFMQIPEYRRALAEHGSLDPAKA